MNDRQPVIDEIFLEAIELPAEDRPAFLALRSAGLDSIVREEVEKLLEADIEASMADLTEASSAGSILAQKWVRRVLL